MRLPFKWTTAASAFLAFGLVAAGASALMAQSNPQTPQDWERLLAPPPPSQPGFRSLKDRGIEVRPGREMVTPSVDLYLNFAFDSAELDADAMRTLRSLGAALKGEKLKDARLQIIGHTDAKGSDEYNQTLSERRAAAVRQFLLFAQDIDGARLETVGRGKRELKDPSSPLDGINRRVEIRNVTAIASK